MNDNAVYSTINTHNNEKITNSQLKLKYVLPCNLINFPVVDVLVFAFSSYTGKI